MSYFSRLDLFARLIGSTTTANTSTTNPNAKAPSHQSQPIAYSPRLPLEVVLAQVSRFVLRDGNATRALVPSPDDARVATNSVSAPDIAGTAVASLAVHQQHDATADKFMRAA